MMHGKREPKSRKVIRFLKDQYHGGRSFNDRYELAEEIRQAFAGTEFGRITPAQAVRLDRRARLELAAIKRYVTQPTPRIRYVRNPEAHLEARRTAELAKYIALRTLVENMLTHAEAAAAQADAGYIEHTNAAELRTALRSIDYMVTITSGGLAA